MNNLNLENFTGVRVVLLPSRLDDDGAMKELYMVELQYSDGTEKSFYFTKLDQARKRCAEIWEVANAQA